MELNWCLNTLYIKPHDIKSKIETCSKFGFKGVELWVEEIEDDPKLVKKILNDNGVYACSVEKIVGWFENDGELMGVPSNHLKIMDECKRRMELASMIGSNKIIACPSFSHRGFHAPLNQGVDYFKELVDIGKSYEIEPVIEFMGQTGQINNISSVLKFLSFIDNSRTIVDAYHVWRGGDSMSNLFKLKLNQIGMLHISDASGSIPRLEHKDRDRLLPGDGCIDLKGFLKNISIIGYNGNISLGVYNPKFWELSIFEAVKLARDKCNELFAF